MNGHVLRGLPPRPLALSLRVCPIALLGCSAPLRVPLGSRLAGEHDTLRTIEPPPETTIF